MSPTSSHPPGCSLTTSKKSLVSFGRPLKAEKWIHTQPSKTYKSSLVFQFEAKNATTFRTCPNSRKATARSPSRSREELGLKPHCRAIPGTAPSGGQRASPRRTNGRPSTSCNLSSRRETAAGAPSSILFRRLQLPSSGG